MLRNCDPQLTEICNRHPPWTSLASAQSLSESTDSRGQECSPYMWSNWKLHTKGHSSHVVRQREKWPNRWTYMLLGTCSLGHHLMISCQYSTIWWSNPKKYDSFYCYKVKAQILPQQRTTREGVKGINMTWIHWERHKGKKRVWLLFSLNCDSLGKKCKGKSKHCTANHSSQRKPIPHTPLLIPWSSHGPHQLPSAFAPPPKPV